MTLWWTILAGAIVGTASLLGMVLVLLTLPGIWFMLIAAAACQVLLPAPGPFSWWTLGICAGAALAAEIFEFVASAVGARKSGGGRAGAIGSIIGATVGAIAGSFIVPIVGTIFGAVVGAGLGALTAERGIAGKSWSQSAAIGTGAAAGRLTATVVKAILAVAIGVALTVAAVV